MEKRLGRAIGILIGNAVLALGIAAFIIPNEFLVGGSTGIARCMDYYFHFPMAVTVGVVNVVMFGLGLYFLGKEFALTTVISTIIYPIFLNQFLQMETLKALTGDKLLAALLGGLLLGGGLGLVMRLGGSTGGMDIPPLILNRKFRIPVAAAIYIFDVAILLAQILYSDTEQILYGVVSVLITTVVLNQVLVVGTGDVQVFIISSESGRINRGILEELDRGSTYVPVRTGFKGEDQMAILCVLPNRDVSRLNRLVLKIDSKAFMIISGAREVRGRGFTLDRHAE